MADSGAVHTIELTINGEAQTHNVLSRQLLVHFIRDTLGMRGTHICCDTGNCGACTVVVDGQPVKSCMMLAAQADGRSIETVEGLGDGPDDLTPLQEAFREHHGLQCGFCTPGVLLNAKTLLEENPNPSTEDIRRALLGNICRCTGYTNIVKSIEAAAEAAR
jgi:carbon-monoxide dehydrogenase small subunit